MIAGPVPTRNVSLGVMAIGTFLVLGFAVVVTARQGGWWWLVTAVLAFLAASTAYGVVESFQKVPRDAKGNRIK